MNSPDALLALAALAHASRLQVYRLLVRRGPEGYTPSQLLAQLELPPATLSFHLKALRGAGLVAVRRAGRHRFYSPDFTQMEALVGFLTDHCCSLGSAAAAACCPPALPVALPRPRQRA